MNRGATLSLAALAAVLSIFACQPQWGENGLARLEELNPPSDAGASAPPPDTDASDDTDAPPSASSCPLPDDADAGAGEAPSTSCVSLTSGLWAVRLVQSQYLALLEDNLTLTDLFLAQPSSDGTSLQLTFCGEENLLTDSTGQPATLGENTVPPLLVNALASHPLAVPLPGNGTIQASGVVWLWGLQNLANPATDPLPTSPDAGTVWDEDMDGFPGVTVDVISPAGEIYMVKRAVFDFAQSTSAGAGGWFTGSLSAKDGQEIVGASTSILDTTPTFTQQSCTDVYQLKCVDPTFTCAALVQGYQTLFVGAPRP